MGERLLLARQGVVRIAGDEQFLGDRHLHEAGVEVLHDLGELRVRPDAAVAETPVQRRHLLPEPALGEADGGHRFRDRARRHSLAVAEDLEGGDHDLLLAEGERAVEAVAAAGPAPTRHGVALPVGPVERPHRDEEDVGCGFGAGPVPRHRVVGDEITRHEVVFLEEQRVPGLDLVPGPSRRQHLPGLLTAVDRDPHLDLPHRVVVLRQDLGEHLLHRVGLRVPAGAQEPHDGRQVLEHLDQVVAGGRAEVPVRPRERHPVGAALREPERGRQHLGAGAGGRVGGRLRHFEGDLDRPRLQAQHAGRRRHRGDHPELDHGVGHGGDVSPVLDLAGAESGVLRIAIEQADLLHVGDVLDLDPERRGQHPVRIDVVVRRFRNPEQQVPEGAVLRVGKHRDRFPERTALDAGAEVHPLRREPFQPGCDPPVRVAGDGRVARVHQHPVGVRVADVPPGRKEEGGAAKQRGRREQRRHEGDAPDGGERSSGPAERRGLDQPALVQRLEAADGLLHHQPRQVRGDPAPAGIVLRFPVTQLNPAADRFPQRGIVFLDVERHLLVGDPGAERPEDETPDGGPEGEPRRRLQPANHPRRVAQRVHRRRRHPDDQHGGRPDHREAEEEAPGPPAVPHPADDPEKVVVGGVCRRVQSERRHGRGAVGV